MTDIEYLRLQVDGAIPTLRDQFAMQILNGVLSSNPEISPHDQAKERLAKFCYEIADAMMSQRDKK